MNAPMTPDQLAEILARAEAALPGPWCTDAWEIYQGTEYEVGAEWIGETARGVGGAADMEQDRATASFVAAARTDVPDLVAAVRLLMAERDGLRARVAELETAQTVALAPHVLYPDSAHCRADGDPWPCPTVTALAPAAAPAEDSEDSAPDPLTYGPTGYRCGCGKDAHSNLTPCQPMTADEWNERYPIGTPVLAYPGTRDADPLDTVTRTPAWTLGHGAAAAAVVSVEGAAGGIRLTHVDPIGGAA
ncbi:hypothetical protein [Streptomyces sp. NPDC005989]|uniref:hypothetical protein n=1 Tax=Streptomyces sp. NPDC005989 TaxID=3156727 RepID=UPI0033D9E0A4